MAWSALGQRTLSPPGWAGLALAVWTACLVGCGSRSALDSLDLPGSAASNPARGGHTADDAEGGRSSRAGAAGKTSGQGGDGGSEPRGGAGGSPDSDTSLAVDIPAAASGTRLHAQMLSTPDGVQVFVGFFDTLRGEACKLSSMPDRKVLCLPTDEVTNTLYVRDGKPASSGGPYSDAACTKRVVKADGWDCHHQPHAKYIVNTVVRTTEGAQPTSCDDPDWEIRQVGGAIELETLYYANEKGECYSTAVQRAGYLEESDPIPHAAFVAASEQIRDMPSRLRVREWVAEDESRQVLGWYDSQRKELCDFVLMEDNATRCVPTVQAWAAYFDDASCRDPVADIRSSVCNAPLLQYVGTVAGESCSGGLQLFRPGEAVPEGTPILFGGGQCDRVGAFAGAEHPFVRLGAPIPSASFDLLRTVWAGRGRLRELRLANAEGFTIPAMLAIPQDSWIPWARFADTERQEYCSFQTTEDGLQRCVPGSFKIEDWSPRDAPTPPTGFSLDPACASPNLSFLRRAFCAPDPPKALYPDAPKSALATTQVDACTSIASIWSVPEAHHPAIDPVYWHGNQPMPAECTQLRAAGPDYFGIVGEQIPRTAFQASVLITE